MRIDVQTYHSYTDKDRFADKTIIAIDVLRCTSAMIEALSNGAKCIIPRIDTEEAIDLAVSLGRESCVVGGERGCNIVPGFDVGNSPFEYSAEKVSGKTVIISTSNGTNAICGIHNAETMLIGAMINASAAAKAAAKAGNDVMIVCSGTNDMDSADDFCAAGSIIERLLELVPDAFLTDAAMVCRQLYCDWRTGSFRLLDAFHCKRLAALGYGRDLEFCLTEDIRPVVPVVHGDMITL